MRSGELTRPAGSAGQPVLHVGGNLWGVRMTDDNAPELSGQL